MQRRRREIIGGRGVGAVGDHVVVVAVVPGNAEPGESVGGVRPNQVKTKGR